MKEKSHRATIFVVQAQILEHQHHAGEQHLLRLDAPQIAALAEPGSFVHIQVSPHRPLRRPLSIMRVERRTGTIDLLYKSVGAGTSLLAQRLPGEEIDLIGPIGTPFKPSSERPRSLLIGGGVGMPPMIFLAEYLREMVADHTPLVLLGSEVPFPFPLRPARTVVSGLSLESPAALSLLDDLGVPSRLASRQSYPGCFSGYVTDLARCWLDSLSAVQRGEVEVFGCGPHPMLAAVAKLAAEYDLPCHISMEEFMACGVGGCAGCVVEVQTAEGLAMKRICVDGPVFDATTIFF